MLLVYETYDKKLLETSDFLYKAAGKNPIPHSK